MDFINPLKYVTSGQYVAFWQMLFATLLQGFWSRMFAILALGLSYWFGVRRRRTAAGFFFLAISTAIVYGYPLFKWAGVGK